MTALLTTLSGAIRLLLLAGLLATTLLLSGLLAGLIALLLLVRALIRLLILAHPVFLQHLLASVSRRSPSGLSCRRDNAAQNPFVPARPPSGVSGTGAHLPQFPHHCRSRRALLIMVLRPSVLARGDVGKASWTLWKFFSSS
ncbi:MAG: hypothetical protein Q8M26_06645 [Pseudolabrys sp.]|nr:hypothetical protein [Pseudolabrys sp.]